MGCPICFYALYYEGRTFYTFCLHLSGGTAARQINQRNWNFEIAKQIGCQSTLMIRLANVSRHYLYMAFNNSNAEAVSNLFELKYQLPRVRIELTTSASLSYPALFISIRRANRLRHAPGHLDTLYICDLTYWSIEIGLLCKINHGSISYCVSMIGRSFQNFIHVTGTTLLLYYTITIWFWQCNPRKDLYTEAMKLIFELN